MVVDDIEYHVFTKCFIQLELTTFFVFLIQILNQIFGRVYFHFTVLCSHCLFFSRNVSLPWNWFVQIDYEKFLVLVHFANMDIHVRWKFGFFGAVRTLVTRLFAALKVIMTLHVRNSLVSTIATRTMKLLATRGSFLQLNPRPWMLWRRWESRRPSNRMLMGIHPDSRHLSPRSSINIVSRIKISRLCESTSACHFGADDPCWMSTTYNLSRSWNMKKKTNMKLFSAPRNWFCSNTGVTMRRPWEQIILIYFSFSFRNANLSRKNYWSTSSKCRKENQLPFSPAWLRKTLAFGYSSQNKKQSNLWINFLKVWLKIWPEND